MKFAFLAATALAFSVPAFAQDGNTTPPAGDDMMQMQDDTMMDDPAMQTPPTADPMMQTAPGGMMSPGGYAPAAPPMAGMAQPGGQVVFRPSVPVAQAFPPPPPRDNYPVCRGNVQDACRNPGES